MVIMKIFFAVLIAICIVFYIMYLWDFALILLITVIAVPVVMLVATLIAKKNINVDFSVSSNTVMKNEAFPIHIKITNSSIIPIGKAEAFIEYCNFFDNEVNTFNLLLPIQALNTQNISFQLNSSFCGIVSIKCAYINIYDPLKIFRFRVGNNVHKEITIMPEGHEIGGQICSVDRENDESEIFSEYKAGDDPSEIFDLRDYHAGDKPNRIHWKLSSKKGEFIVKDYSLPVDTPCTLFINMQVDSKYRLPVYDTLIETLVSVSQFMLENERIHSVVYYNSGAGNFIERVIMNTDSLMELIQELILSSGSMAECQPPKNYFAEKDNLALSSFVFITSDTEQQILEYIDNDVDADIKNAIVVVTSPTEADSIARDYMNMAIIPVVIGRIASSIKDIEL